MKVLAISDEVAPQVYDAGIQTRFADVDLVLGCGDLPHYYLEYVVTMLNVPLYYVMGNHGLELKHGSSDRGTEGPGGCIEIDERAVDHGGLLIAGLEGSMRYKPGPYQYSNGEMSRKALRLGTRLLRHRLFRQRRLDVLITHAPPFGIHDGKDVCHTGFRAFLTFMNRYRPRYLIHGHSHVHSQLQTTTTKYGDTVVANVHPYRVLEISAPSATVRSETA